MSAQLMCMFLAETKSEGSETKVSLFHFTFKFSESEKVFYSFYFSKRRREVTILIPLGRETLRIS